MPFFIKNANRIYISVNNFTNIMNGETKLISPN